MTDCDNYLKYLVVLKFEGFERITVWGSDQEFDGDDKFLIDKKKNILLFNSKEDVFEFCKKNTDLFFDKKNMLKWVKIIKDEEINGIIDLDILMEVTNTLDSGFKKARASMLIDVLNIITDYAIQVNNKRLLKHLEGKPLIKLKDYLYDNYFWKRDTNKKIPSFSNLKIEKSMKIIQGEFIKILREVS